ncbi:hypothetical protein NDU88_001143 [Pleurodeles waltl]|uniref:Uncharacterized protein n=1 Tax=Pleurodeles waltl TaxID=8319 RepID=A0AAV7WLA3_PLEWA|nr:hypothetical protein NDU88_001143 [Pleurodeles waltl]
MSEARRERSMCLLSSSPMCPHADTAVRLWTAECHTRSGACGQIWQRRTALALRAQLEEQSDHTGDREEQRVVHMVCAWEVQRPRHWEKQGKSDWWHP